MEEVKKIIKLIDDTIKKINECNKQIQDLIRTINFYKIDIQEDNVKILTEVFKIQKKFYK